MFEGYCKASKLNMLYNIKSSHVDAWATMLVILRQATNSKH